MTAPWLETTLPTILSRYPIENVFNADEFGLFYQCLPNKNFHFKKEKCSGGKHSKVRLTGMAVGNAKGERLPIFAIGKAKNPRCFKGVKSIPWRYRAQAKSWMSSELFEEWIKELDRSFGVQKRKIALIVGNCPAHPTVTGLEWIELIFLPPNTTSVTQPMGQGVIRALKAKYRSLAVRKQLANLEKGKQLPKISILTAMTMLNKAWGSIPDRYFYEESAEKALNDEDDPFANLDVEEDVIEDLRGDLQVMKEKFNVNFELTAEELVDIDFEISVTGAISDKDIIAEVSGSVDCKDSSEDDDFDNEEPTELLTKPDFKDAMNAISILEDYSIFTKFGVDLRKALNDTSRVLELDHHVNKRQSKIEDFFLEILNLCS